MGGPGADRGRFARVVVLDLDGTLLPGTTVAILLAEAFGDPAGSEDLERAFVAGEVSDRHMADAAATVLAGRSTDEITAVLADAPWIDGIGETVAALRAASSDVLLATVGWRVAAEHLRALHGIDATCGTEFAVTGGLADGTVARTVDADGKRRFVEGWCARRGVPLAEVVAVGDSRSDLPLFGAVGRSVALNATDEARRAATDVLDTGDLRDVLPLLTR